MNNIEFCYINNNVEIVITNISNSKFYDLLRANVSFATNQKYNVELVDNGYRFNSNFTPEQIKQIFNGVKDCGAKITINNDIKDWLLF